MAQNVAEPKLMSISRRLTNPRRAIVLFSLKILTVIHAVHYLVAGMKALRLGKEHLVGSQDLGKIPHPLLLLLDAYLWVMMKAMKMTTMIGI